MTTALNEAKCPNCGKPLAKGALAGLCPACLLDGGGEAQTAEEPARKGFQPPSLEAVSRLFPQLTILQLIGAGGMGAVYKARQPSLDRFVALKILPPGSAGGVNFAERFTREARALARLSHPNIVAVHEFGQADGLHYFIMEYVDGANLRQLEQAGRLSPREALQIIPQICDALQYAHDEGVVHRDIKPENVLVDRKGRVKIADFGLARILGIETDSARLTVEGQVMGTPHYMAPEQVERPLAVDHRADIYSLGVVFYEMLTGDLPLGKFPPPSRKVSIDVRLDEVVLRALENDPARRYQHASEVKSELQTISESPPAPVPVAAPQGPVERYIHWAGIPLVVDRDGEREIIWNGGLTAVGVGFLLTAGGLLLFQVVTGQPSLKLAGIPTLITIFILGAGFRWAMNAPVPAEEKPIVAKDGTVILNRPRRRMTWQFLALGSILPAVFAWGLVKNYGLPALHRALRAQSAAQVAQHNPETGTLAVNLPQRGKVELVAVSFTDSAPNQWWRPDGRLLTDERFTIENLSRGAFPGMTNHDLVFRLTDLPDNASGPVFANPASGGYSSGGNVFWNDAPLANATGVRVAAAPNLRSLDIRMGFGLGAWRTIATQYPDRQHASFTNAPGDPQWEANFHKVSDTSEGAQITVVMSPESRQWHRRIVALDKANREHYYSMGSGTSGKESSTWTYTFSRLPLANVQEFRIQVQPIHWMEFRNIQLEPEQPLPAPKTIRWLKRGGGTAVVAGSHSDLIPSPP